MKLEILKERETPLLSRKRISLMAVYEGPTPSRMKFLTEVAKLVDADPSLIIIKHVYTRFGRQKAKIIAHVYTDAKEMAKLEDEYLLKKHVKKEEKKSEDKVADAAAKDTAAKVEATEAQTTEPKAEEKKEEKKEEPKEEKPAEEKKEEAPKEEKKEESK